MAPGSTRPGGFAARAMCIMLVCVDRRRSAEHSTEPRQALSRTIRSSGQNEHPLPTLSLLVLHLIRVPITPVV